jgi:hypothetical protein
MSVDLMVFTSKRCQIYCYGKRPGLDSPAVLPLTFFKGADMRTIIFLALVTLGFGMAHAESVISDSVGFGTRDARGADQEVRIKTIKVKQDYFQESEQSELRSV